MKAFSLTGLGIFLLLAALPARSLFAEHTRHWRQSNYEDFLKGNPKGVAIRSDGRLSLAPCFADFADAGLSFLWAARFDTKGRLYAAGGSPAKVLRFDDSGKPETIFQSSELFAQALAFDSKGNLYVGTSPDGKVYRVTPQGEKSVFFDPKTKYIWDLALAPDGVLYVATGDKGEIFAVTPDGKGMLFYSTSETHIRVLALDGEERLFAGTEPNGRILRIALPSGVGAPHPTRSAPEGFVVFETTKKEVTSLLVGREGELYAAAIGEKQGAPPSVPLVPAVPAQATVTITTALAPAAAATATVGQQPGLFAPFPPVSSSAVYRISADGAPEELWNSRNELVYALGFSPEGHLLLATGNNGAVIEVEGPGVFSSVAKTGSSQVTCITRGPGDKLFLCTANPGRVVTLGPGREAQGVYESQPFDARIFSQWGRLEWWGPGAAREEPSAKHLPRGEKPYVEFYVRSGNTADPGKEWSPWFGPYTSPGGQKAECPSARFTQWKAVLRDGQPQPEIDWVTLAYLPRNVAPEVDAIVLQDSGVRVQSIAAGSVPNVPAPVPLKLPPQSNAGEAFAAGPAVASAEERNKTHMEVPPQGFAQKGYRSVLWTAHDDNDDDLQYSIYFRGEGEKEWRLLKDKIDAKFYSWDTTTMADGAYYLKIVASDAPSNPPELARTGERTSERFVVDNTPPVIEGLLVEPLAENSSEMRVRWRVRDNMSALARAEYSLDAKDWTPLYPVGNLSDAREENYEVVLRGLPPGEHTVAVRVADSFENLAAAKVAFATPASPR